MNCFWLENSNKKKMKREKHEKKPTVIPRSELEKKERKLRESFESMRFPELFCKIRKHDEFNQSLYILFI